MKIVIGIPSIDMHDITGQNMSVTASYIKNKKDVTFVVVDNGSKKLYKKIQNSGEINIDIINNKNNKGYYYPLLQLYKKYPNADYIGLMHNDTSIYEDGWDEKIHKAFKKDTKLALIGLFGWQKVSRSAKSEFPIGKIYWPQGDFPLEYSDSKSPTYHRRIDKVTPALIVDSLFMVFKRDIIPFLMIDENITISHGYDKIWSLRLIEQGYHVGIMDISFMHVGGEKSEEVRKIFKKWFDERWETDTPIDFVYGTAFFETQVLIVNEFRDRKNMIPATIDDNYKIKKLKT